MFGTFENSFFKEELFDLELLWFLIHRIIRRVFRLRSAGTIDISKNFRLQNFDAFFYEKRKMLFY